MENQIGSKVILCSHCHHINALNTKFCDKCGFLVADKEPMDIEKAKAEQLIAIKPLIENDKKQYEAALKKRKLFNKIFIPIILVWVLLLGITGFVSKLMGPQDSYETIKVDYKTYSEILSVGDDAKIEVKIYIPLAYERKTVNGVYTGMNDSIYFYVTTTDNNSGIIKISNAGAKTKFGNYMFDYIPDEPITLYGNIIETPEDELLEYEKKNNILIEEDGTLGDIMRKYNILSVNDVPEKERQIFIKAEKTAADTVFLVVLCFAPVMLIFLTVLLKYRKPRREYPNDAFESPENT